MKTKILLALLLLIAVPFSYTYYNYWVEKNYNTNNYERIWTILNLSSASSTSLYVYYGGSTYKGDGSKVFIWFDDFTNGYTKNVLLGGQNGWTAEYDGAYIYSVDGTEYGANATNRPGYYKTFSPNGNFLVEFYFYESAVSSNARNIWIYNSAGNERAYIYSNANNWYWYDGASHAFAPVVSGEWHWWGFDISQSTTNVDFYRDRTLKANGFGRNSGDAQKFHWRWSNTISGDVLKYILARKFDSTATITISYGSEETGSWSINGETYTKRRQITITTDKDLTDYQIDLNYTFFNDNKMTITDDPGTPPPTINKTSPTYNQTQYNPVVFEFEVLSDHTIDTCNLNLDGTPYAMTKVNATLCNISKVLSVGNHTYYFEGTATYNPTSESTTYSSETWSIEKLPEPPLAENLTTTIESIKTETTKGTITAQADKLSNETNITTEWAVYYNNTKIYNISGTEIWNISTNYTAPFIYNDTSVSWKVELIVSNSTTSQLYENEGNQTIQIGLFVENTYLTNETLLGMDVYYEANFTRNTNNLNLEDVYFNIYNSSNDLVRSEALDCSGLVCSKNFSFNKSGVFTTKLLYNKTYNTESFEYEYNDLDLNVQDFFLSANVGNTCSNSSYTKLTTFYTKDEENQDYVLSDFKMDIAYKIGTASKELNVSTTNQTNITLCYYPSYGGFYVDSFEEYTANGKTTRHRFFRNMYITGTLDDTSIYLLNSSKSTEVLFQVRENGVTKTGVDVQVLRYYIDSSSYLRVDEVRMNSEYGKSYLDINQWYKFKILDRDGNILYQTSGPEQIICTSTPCIKTIRYSTSNTTLIKYSQLNADCEPVNTTNSIKCNYIDGTGSTKKINFLIKSAATTICSTTIEESSAEYICTLSDKGYNLSSDIITWTISREASPEIVVNSGIIDLRNLKSIVYSWIFVAIAFISVFILILLVYHPGLGIAAGGISFFILNILEVLDFGLGVSATILAVSLALAWYVSR